MNPTRWCRYGFATMVSQEGIEFAIFATSEEKLRNAFIKITGGKLHFDAQQVGRVRLSPIRKKEVVS